MRLRIWFALAAGCIVVVGALCAPVGVAGPNPIMVGPRAAAPSGTATGDIHFPDDTEASFGNTDAAPDAWIDNNGTMWCYTSTSVDGAGTDGDLWCYTLGGNLVVYTAAVTVNGTLTAGADLATAAAADFDLLDNNASALSFDAAGKSGILNIITTDAGEGVSMSGTLDVTGAITVSSTVDGVDVAGHASRHLDGGADEIEADELAATGNTDGWVLTAVGDGSIAWEAIPAQGDITDVFGCATGDCASISLGATDLLNMSGVDASATNEGLILPQHATACAGGTAEGQVCWEADANILHIGDAATIVQFVPTSGFSGDATVSVTGVVTVADDGHAHTTTTISGLAAADITSGTLAHERGGLEADVSAYAGLVKISGGATSAVTNLSGLNTALGSTIADGAHTGDVTKSGTPANDQVCVWTGDGTAEGSNNFTIDSSGYVTVGADGAGAAAEGAIMMYDVGETGSQRIKLRGYGSGFNQFIFDKSEGTKAAPTATSDGKVLGLVGGGGYDGTLWTTATKADVRFGATELWDGSGQGTDIQLRTTPNNSTTKATRLTITDTAITAGANLTMAGYLVTDATDALELGTACTGGAAGDVCTSGALHAESTLTVTGASSLDDVTTTGQAAYTPAATATVSANAFTWDVSTGSVQRVDLEACTGGGNCAATINGEVTGGSYYFIITQGASLETVTWNGGTFMWTGGTTPTTTATNNAIDVVTCFYDGTNFYCSTIQDMQ